MLRIYNVERQAIIVAAVFVGKHLLS